MGHPTFRNGVKQSLSREIASPFSFDEGLAMTETGWNGAFSHGFLSRSQSVSNPRRSNPAEPLDVARPQRLERLFGRHEFRFLAGGALSPPKHLPTNEALHAMPLSMLRTFERLDFI